MKLICFGDSLTFGYGVDRDKCWVSRMEKALDVHALNYGVNGDTTAYILQRVKANIGESIIGPGDKVCIMGGENDVLTYGATLYDAMNLAGACGFVRDAGGETLVIIQPGFEEARFPFYDDFDMIVLNNNHDDYASMLMNECAKQGVKVIDLRPLFKGHPELFIDGVHPTEEGHALIAEKVLAEL